MFAIAHVPSISREITQPLSIGEAQAIYGQMYALGEFSVLSLGGEMISIYQWRERAMKAARANA